MLQEQVNELCEKIEKLFPAETILVLYRKLNGHNEHRELLRTTIDKIKILLDELRDSLNR